MKAQVNFDSLGSGKCKRGTFTASTSATVSVNDIGFKPKYLIVSMSKPSTGVTDIAIIYDEDIDPNNQIFWYEDSGTSGKLILALNATRIDTIASIDANGFTFNKASSIATVGPYYYYAIG